MNKHLNLIAYKAVEDLNNFDEDSFREYCSAKLASCANYVKFIRMHCLNSSWQGKVCEIGSGNSRLLYRLEQEGLLNTGVGYETSSSRHTFAEKFREYLHIQNVMNINENILNAPCQEKFDLVIGIDEVLQLIAPLYPIALTDVLSWINQSLKMGGYLFLELMDYQHILQMINLTENGVYHWWQEFPEHDPWEFSLVRFSLDEQKDIVWNKLFLKRASMERSRMVYVLRDYSPEDIAGALEEAGFSTQVFSEADSGIKLEQGEYLVLAKKVAEK